MGNFHELTAGFFEDRDLSRSRAARNSALKGPAAADGAPQIVTDPALIQVRSYFSAIIRHPRILRRDELARSLGAGRTGRIRVRGKHWAIIRRRLRRCKGPFRLDPRGFLAVRVLVCRAVDSHALGALRSMIWYHRRVDRSSRLRHGVFRLRIVDPATRRWWATLMFGSAWPRSFSDRRDSLCS